MLMQYLVIGFLILVIAYVLSPIGDRPKPLPQPMPHQMGMIPLYCHILRELFSDNLQYKHMKGIDELMADFKTRFFHKVEFEEYYEILLYQYRKAAEKFGTEVMVVNADGNLDYQVA